MRRTPARSPGDEQGARNWLQILNDHWIGPNGQYLCGNELTIADYFGAAVVSIGELVGSDFSAYPNVGRWLGNMKKLKSWTHINEVFDGFVAANKGKEFVQAVSLPLCQRLRATIMRLSASGGRLFAAAMIWISRAGRLGRAAIISVGGTRRHDVSLRPLPRGAWPYLVAHMRSPAGLVSLGGPSADATP